MSLNDNLVAEWNFAGTNPLTDVVNGYSLTEINGATVSGGAAQFNGINQTMQTPSNSNLQGGDRSYSMYVQFSLSSLSNSVVIAGKGGEYFLQYYQPTNKFRFVTVASGGGLQIVALLLTTPVINTTFGILCFYNNISPGVRTQTIVDTSACSGGSAISYSTPQDGLTSNPFEIGGLSGGNFAPASVNQVWFWDRAVSSTDDCSALSIGYIYPGCSAVACLGGTVTFTVTATSTGSLTYTSSAGWLSATGPSSGTGTATVTVASNSGGSLRIGTITVGGAVFTVVQLGGC